MSRGVSALAFHLNRRERKVPARLITGDFGRYRGLKVICRAEIIDDRNSEGEPIKVVQLQPTNKARATHGTPFFNGDQIVIPAM